MTVGKFSRTLDSLLSRIRAQRVTSATKGRITLENVDGDITVKVGEIVLVTQLTTGNVVYSIYSDKTAEYVLKFLTEITCEN